MGILREWLSRIAGAVGRRRTDADLAEELELHRALAAEDGVRTGSIAHAMDPLRDQRGLPWVADFGRDLRYSLRMLVRARGFALTTILMLAVGIGVNTAIFSLIDALVLRPLPVPRPGELVILTDPAVGGAAGGLVLGERDHVTFAEFQTLRERMTSFKGMFASASYMAKVDARVDGHAQEPIQARLVSGDFFGVLGIPAAAGRTFSRSDEHGPGSAPYVVISDAYWQRRFGRRLSAINSQLRIEDATLTIIGIAPPGFLGETVGEAPDVWIPAVMQPQLTPGMNWLGAQNTIQWLHAIGRLAPGVTLERAQAEANVIFGQMLRELSQRVHPRFAKDVLQQHLMLRPASRGISPLRGSYTVGLYILMGLVALLLLIACASVATLLLARAGSRAQEFDVRLAIGAGWSRLFRQLVTESLVVATIAAAAGAALAFVAVRLLVATVLGGAEGTPVVTVSDLGVRPDLRILTFTAAICVFTVLASALAPSWRAARQNRGAPARTGAAARGQLPARARLGRTLVACQVAVSVVLLVGAGWFVRTFRNLDTVDLGYTRQIEQVTVNFRGVGGDASRAYAIRDLVRQRLAAVPGVHAVSYSQTGLLGENYIPIAIEGFQAPNPRDTVVKLVEVGPDYFASLGIELASGRGIEPRDNADARLVCVINESFARFFFANRNPIGQLVLLGDERYQVVGVAKDTRDTLTYPLSLAENLKASPARTFYPAAAQFNRARGFQSTVYQVTTDYPMAALPGVREAIRDVHPGLVVTQAEPIDSRVSALVQRERIIAQLASIIGVIAVMLACIGLYGLLSHQVTRRTSEIGVRVALGAKRREIVGMVLREMGVLAAIGIAIGIPLSLGAAGLVRNQLFGLTPADLPTLAGAMTLTSIVAAVAGYLPARRAARIDPVVAIRTE